MKNWLVTARVTSFKYLGKALKKKIKAKWTFRPKTRRLNVLLPYDDDVHASNVDCKPPPAKFCGRTRFLFQFINKHHIYHDVQ